MLITHYFLHMYPREIFFEDTYPRKIKYIIFGFLTFPPPPTPKKKKKRSYVCPMYLVGTWAQVIKNGLENQGLKLAQVTKAIPVTEIDPTL